MSAETPRLKFPPIPEGIQVTADTWTEALERLDALCDLYLLGQFANTPPAAPADGDAYLTGGSPGGAWTNQSYKIASCLDGGWRFYAPFNGLRAYVAPTGAFLLYLNGQWLDCSSLLSASETAIASAATCDLGAANALFVQITGTATIASFGPGAGKLRFVRFAQALTLTHNATSLILLGNASRTTAAGDLGIYASDASGNWRERCYFSAAANPGDYATRSGTQTLTNKTLASPAVTGMLTGASANFSGNFGIGTANPAVALDVGGQVKAVSGIFPVLQLTRTTPNGSGAIWGTQLLTVNQADNTAAGAGTYYKANNSSGAVTFAGMFGGGLTTVTAGSEIGQLVFTAAFHGADPGSNQHLTITATGAASADVSVPNGNLAINTASPKSRLHVVGLPVYANNAAAVAGGLTAGAFYRTGADPDPVCVVH
jgi:hypothetical protein